MATYFFDKNGATAGFGTLTGNWADVSWSLSGAGTSGTFVTWPGAGNVASFGGTSNTATAGTITASGTINLDGVITQNLTGSQTLTGGTLNFGSGTSTIDVQSASNFIINSAITGSGTLNVNSTTSAGGIVFVYGSTTGLSGTINHNAGSNLLVFEPTGSPVTSLAAGTNIVVASGRVTMSRPNAASQLITFNGSLSGAGAFSYQGDQAIATVTVAGSVSGLNIVKVYGSGTLNINSLPYGAINFDGLSTTTATLNINLSDASPVSVSTALNLSQYVGTPTSSATWNLKSIGSQYFTTSGGINRTDNYTAAYTFVLGGTASGNAINGPGSNLGATKVQLWKVDTGTWRLGGNNNPVIDGILIDNGVLTLANPDAAGNTASGITMQTTGAVLALEGGGVNVSKTVNTTRGTIRNTSGNNTLSGPLVLAGATTFESQSGTLSLTSATSITGSGIAIAFSGAGNHTVTSVIATGAGTVTKNGAGTTTLNGANSFSGSFAHNAGVIEANTITSSGNNSLGTGTSYTFGGAGTLRYTGSTPATLAKTTVSVPASGAVFENNGAGAWTVSSLTAASAGTVLGLAGSNSGYNKLSPASTPANLVGFTKTGAGRWISTLNVNPASGSTAVNGGTLVASNSNGTSKLFGYDVTVASGAMIQTGSDEVGQAGKCAYHDLTFNGTVGTPARIRIGGSVVNPTIYMNGNLALPVSGTVTFNATADVFKTPGTYTLVEFAGAFGVTGGTVASNAVAVAPTGRTGTLAYVAGTPNRITVTIS